MSTNLKWIILKMLLAIINGIAIADTSNKDSFSQSTYLSKGGFFHFLCLGI